MWYGLYFHIFLIEAFDFLILTYSNLSTFLSLLTVLFATWSLQWSFKFLPFTSKSIIHLGTDFCVSARELNPFFPHSEQRHPQHHFLTFYFSSVICKTTYIKYRIPQHAWVCFWTLTFPSLAILFIILIILYCFNYCSLIINLNRKVSPISPPHCSLGQLWWFLGLTVSYNILTNNNVSMIS